jgi:hypothetical protein
MFIFKLLEQATSRLQLRNAARRLYTEDGVLILDVQDLIDWAIDYYRRELEKMESTPGQNLDIFTQLNLFK